MNYDYYNQIAAYTLIRIILGLLFLLQGYDKVFRIKMSGIIDAYRWPSPQPFIPKAVVWAGACYTSYCELICGALLLTGLFTNYALYLLALDLIIATIGLGLQNPEFDTRMFFSRLILLVFLLLCPLNWNLISIDNLFK